ncbi:TetR/AcrR family transcriptional regulator [Paractinoplanes lichenicola]|uniref:TetR/AcrR family transcriptional regulator n=1 Tax=Paractinoplanes lichenicola TaxID=2802976 RepID=A0ABS1VI08_9ACTN|nr:TetR/AcrR family transcriptional regulator [Actinoplanes lichenicola]MBL7254285.1 TetR/AcrR family transcriptional regulator [Actinoplanes lichenicola]
MSDGVRGRAIVEAAAALLRTEGPGAVTTRGVAERAGVQAPTIYRLFGDKDGLLEAVAEHVMAEFVSAKVAGVAAAAAADVDPLDDLRASWRRQLEFGLANPAVFRLLSDPGRVQGSPAARRGRQVLETRVHRLALVGRLRVPEPQAVDLIQAAGVGTIQTLLATPPEQRDAALGDMMLEVVLARILTDAPVGRQGGPVAAAVALRALAPRLGMLSEAERVLLGEWLDRIAAAG